MSKNMAAPMKISSLRHVCKKGFTGHNNLTCLRRLGFISGLKELISPETPKDAQKEVVRVEEPTKPVQEIVDGRRKCIEEQKAYSPPPDLLTIVEAAAVNVYGDNIDMENLPLTNRFQKFNFLTQLIDELEHDVANIDLHEMNTMKDVIDYFSKPVEDTSTYDDLAKIDLPKNLHMNLEPIRFHPDTDTIYGGKTAFPGRPTKVTSMKYKRKYQSYDGGDPANAPWEFK